MNQSPNLIDRPEYIKKLKGWMDHDDLVKIVTGVRRCGKSKLLELFQNRLLEEKIVTSDQIIKINLEDPIQVEKIGLHLNRKQLLFDYKTVLNYILNKLNPNQKNYVFIDEIQLLENWPQVANGLRLLSNVDLYLTGSNAYLFSSDMSNFFGGRFIEIKMQPFSFKEYYNAHLLYLNKTKGSLNLQELFFSYMRESGFPQTIKFLGNVEFINDYLMNTVYLNTLQKDILQRFNIKDPSILNIVVRYLFDNIGKETSIRNIERKLKSAGYNISVPTLSVYIQALIDSYLLYKCDRYDIKGKQFLDSNSKYYIADIALKTVLLGKEDTDIGYALENIVYLELLRRGYRVSVGKVNTHIVKVDGKSVRKATEIDFVAQKIGEHIEYYQVALYALDPLTLKRELSSLEEINDNYPKFLLSFDYGSGENKGIQRLNVLEWLIGKRST